MITHAVDVLLKVLPQALMASKGQFTGMVGVYLVAAELSRRGFITSPTSRSASGADLLVAAPRGNRTFAVEVKTNARTFQFWLLGRGAKGIKSDSLIYALVNLKSDKNGGTEYYLVPSKVVARRMKITLPTRTRKSTWYAIRLDRVEEYKDKWDVFGAHDPARGAKRRARKGRAG